MIAVILLVPFIGTMVSDDINWTAFDFLFAFLMIAGAGLIYETAVRKINNQKYRIVIALTILILFLIIWADQAVGI